MFYLGGSSYGFARISRFSVLIQKNILRIPALMNNIIIQFYMYNIFFTKVKDY